MAKSAKIKTRQPISTVTLLAWGLLALATAFDHIRSFRAAALILYAVDWLALAIAATLTNTLLVLSALALFGDSINGFFELMKTVYLTVIGINGLIELAAAAILTPVLTFALSKVHRD